ncbi:MAG TPA: hypothetical protein VK177_18990 [Flavobacteriales bacterium]|nr:hypothetical protein [Flavobacteriales bacterium]
MKTLFYSVACLCLILTGCGKDDQKPMTDKQFEKMVKLYFSGEWIADDMNNEHQSLNEKSQGLKGKIGANYYFDKNGEYEFTYDTLVNNEESTVTEKGTWLMNNENRRLFLYPGKIIITDKDKNESDLPARVSRYYGVRYLNSEKLYLENYIKKMVTSINSEGAEVHELKDATETLFFVTEKKC